MYGKCPISMITFHCDFYLHKPLVLNQHVLLIYVRMIVIHITRGSISATIMSSSLFLPIILGHLSIDI